MKPTILVVDDQPGTRRLLRNLLERDGYAVVEAADEPSAWQAMHDDEGDCISLALIDVDLPGLGGRFVAENIQLIQPLPVLFMSGHDPATLRAQGLVPLDAPLLPKPFRIADVLDAVGSNLGGPAPLPPSDASVELLLHA